MRGGFGILYRIRNCCACLAEFPTTRAHNLLWSSACYERGRQSIKRSGQHTGVCANPLRPLPGGVYRPNSGQTAYCSKECRRECRGSKRKKPPDDVPLAEPVTCAVDDIQRMSGPCVYTARDSS